MYRERMSPLKSNIPSLFVAVCDCGTYFPVYTGAKHCCLSSVNLQSIAALHGAKPCKGPCECNTCIRNESSFRLLEVLNSLRV